MRQIHFSFSFENHVQIKFKKKHNILCFFLQFILACIAFSYRNIRCPSQSEWKFRSSWICNGTEIQKYSCLFNAIRRNYEESCKFRPVVSGNGELENIVLVFCISFLCIICFLKSHVKSFECQ